MFDKISDYTRDNIIAHTIDVVEGVAYTNRKNDLGGKTKFGVTKKTALRYKRLWQKHNWDGEMSSMPRSFAEEVYTIRYWDKNKLDEISKINPITAYVMFDIGVNMGVSRAGKWFQRSLNVFNLNEKLYDDLVVDGAIGAKSISAFNKFIDRRGDDGVRNITYALSSWQMVKYHKICENLSYQEENMFGWAERVGNAMEQYMKILLDEMS